MPKRPEKERKKLVVEEVQAPIDNEVVSSAELEKTEEKAPEADQTLEEQPKPEVLEEGINTEAPETPSEEMEKEIHEEEKHLHEIHTKASQAEAEILPPVKKQGNPILWILIPGIFLLGALLGGIWFYQKGIGLGSATPTPSATETPAPVATPTPTPLSKADLAKYAIKVENGSGIPGAASDAKDLLTKAGFSVSGTGNADNYSYTDSVIEVKSDVPQAFIDQLSNTLLTTYTLGKNVTHKDSSTDEVVVIVGSSKAH